MRVILLFCILWIVVSGVFSVTWAAPRDRYPKFYEFSSKETGKKYTIVRLLLSYPEENDLFTTLVFPVHQVTDGERVLASALRNRLYRFVYDDVYKKAWPELPPSFFDEMWAEDVKDESPSEIVGIFEGKDLKKPVASFEFAFTDELHPYLPLELALNRKYQRPPITYGAYSTLRRVTSDNQDFLDRFETGALQGAPVELKKYAVSPLADKRDDLGAFIYLLATGDGYMAERPRPMILSEEQVKQLPMSYRTIRQDGRFNRAGIHWVNESEYKLRCNPRMVSLYEKMGFKPDTTPYAPIDSQKVKTLASPDVVMHVDRTQLADLSMDYFKKRRGYGIWSAIEIKGILAQKKRCLSQALQVLLEDESSR